MKAYITGICGFAGGYLTELLLREGCAVFGTKLPQEARPAHLPPDVTVWDADLLDADSIERSLSNCRPDALFHLAAQSSVAHSWKDPKRTFEVNVNGTLTLLEGVRRYVPGCRVLLAGSSEQYGKTPPEAVPISETHPLDPANPYAVSKAAQEMLGRLYASARGLQVVMARAFNHTGPRQMPEFVLPDFSQRIARIEQGKMTPVLKVGNLDAVRDFTDVRDVAAAYYALFRSGLPGEVYNIGSGEGYAIRHLLSELLAMSAATIRVEQDPDRIRPSDVPVLICDHAKITAQTGWKPRIPMQQTLQDVLDFWRSTEAQRGGA